MTSVQGITPEDLRMIASCFNGDMNLFEEVAKMCSGSPAGSTQAAAIARYITSKVSSQELPSVLEQIKGAARAWIPASAPSHALCVTTPTWLHAVSPRTARTETAMINLILHAKRSLRLAFPFIDVASRAVLEQLAFAWRRGCTIRFLCRDASAIGQIVADHEFFDSLVSHSKGASLLVPPKMTGHRWTFHAKVLLADGERAYVGSANLTAASLSEQAEVGVLMHDPHVVAELDEWYSSLWNAMDLADG